MENTLIIRDLASVELWRRQLRKIIWSWNLPVIEFQLEEFSSEQNQSFSTLAGSFQKACGCGSGSFFMSVTVIATVVSYFLEGNHFSSITLPHVLYFVGITVFAALFGKLLGLLWARWRLLRLATNMRNMIVSGTRRPVSNSTV